MNSIPPVGDLALVACVLGGLFALRFVLALRRLDAPGRPLSDRLRHARAANAFGPHAEPDRRHAMRQAWLALGFGVAGLALAMTLALAGPTLS